MMHRLATLLDSEAGKYTEKIDSEWVVGHHLKMHNITVSNARGTSAVCKVGSHPTNVIPFLFHALRMASNEVDG